MRVLATLLERTIPKLPLEVVQSAGQVLGWVAGRVPSGRRRRVEEHLQIAFPDAPPAEIRRLTVASFQATVSYGLENLWIPAWKEADDTRVELLDGANWEETATVARERRRGLVVFTAHLGAPELALGWAIRRVGMPIMVVAGKPKMKALEQPLRRQREAAGVKMLWRGEAGTAAIRHLRGGGAFAMLVDHNLRGPGVELPYFGKPAHTLLAPARLVLSSGATAVVMIFLRHGKGRFAMRCTRPIIPPEYPRDEKARLRLEAELTRDYTAAIEAAIREHPEQYLWMHKRWQKRSETLPWPE